MAHLQGGRMDDVVIVGAALDPDEREDVVDRKHDLQARGALLYHDPYEAVVAKVAFPHTAMGAFPVEPWLTPVPPDSELFMCTVENYVAFIDADGCWEYAEAVRKGMEETLEGRRTLLVAVDHSLAAAPILRACEQHGKEDVGIIMFDSHFDGILPSYRCGLIQYDIDTNPQSPFDPDDPFISCRPESFNADSFLFKLIDEKRIEPENVIIAGVSDYPSVKTEGVRDERVQRFLSFYHHYEELGVTIIPKERLKANPRAFDPAKLGVSAMHVSVDIDVGSRTALYGARFIDYKGLSEQEILAMIAKVRACKAPVMSADLCEIDVWKAGLKHYGKRDLTYDIAARIATALFR